MLENLFAQLAALSPAVKGALLVLAIVQCILQIFCVIDLVRRPAVTGGNKWIWAALIWSTASGCAASGVGVTPASSSAKRTRSSTR